MPEIATLLYSEEEIQGRVRALGAAIAEDFAGRSPVLISVLKGGVIFLADLMRAIDLPVRIDLMSISAYRESSNAGGVVRVLKDLDHDIGGENVIVVEDIIDTGLTLSYLLTALGAREPASLTVCTLLDKSVRRIAPLDIAYRGFESPDKFLVGYGLDIQERYRNLPFILAVDDMSRLKEEPDLLLPYLRSPTPDLAPPHLPDSSNREYIEPESP